VSVAGKLLLFVLVASLVLGAIIAWAPSEDDGQDRLD
jgi:hypothetical protein